MDAQLTRRSLLRAGAATATGLVGTALLAACGTASAGTTSTSTSQATTATSSVSTSSRSVAKSPAAQQVRLTATTWSAVDIAAIYAKLAQGFERHHPAMRVTYTPTSGNYWTKLQTEAAGGVLPDVFWMNAQSLGEWVAKGQLLDLTPLVNRDKYNLQDFWPAKIAAATVNGHLMVLPSQADDIGVFYNATLFQEASVKFPAASYSDKTWDRQAFLTACQHL